MKAGFSKSYKLLFSNIPSSDRHGVFNAVFARNNVEIEFIDEENIPIANILENQASNNEPDSDFVENRSEEGEEKDNNEPQVPQQFTGKTWQRDIHTLVLIWISTNKLNRPKHWSKSRHEGC